MADNLNTVKQIYQAFGRGDVPAILDCLAEDVAWEHWADNSAVKAGVPWLQSRRGRAGAAEFFEYVRTHMNVLQFEVLSIMGSGAQVAAEFVIEVKIPSTGGHYRDEE